MGAPAAGWVFSDAWVFAAIATNPNRCSLAAVIAAADWINHAILLDHEVEDALGKLTGAGFVRIFDDWTFELTDEGVELWPGDRDPLAAAQALLSSLQDFEPGRSTVKLPRGVLAAAVQQYRDGPDPA